MGKMVPYTPCKGIPVRGCCCPFKGKIGSGLEWNRILGGLDTFLTFFVIFRPKVDVPLIETSFVHNALTRRIDPRHPEGPWLHFLFGSRFSILHFSDFGPRAWAHGHRPRARDQGPGPWAQAQGPSPEPAPMGTGPMGTSTGHKAGKVF